MVEYKSEIISLAYPAENVFNRLSNLEGLGDLLRNVPLDQVPEEQRGLLEQVRVTADTISFPAGPVGELTLALTELTDPTLIRLEGQGTPVPMQLSMHITPLTPDTCEAYVVIGVQIPMMARPLVSGPLQKMATQFGQMLRGIRFD